MADGNQWDQPGNTWDDGQTWDAGQGGGNPGNVQPYLDLVTSEHNLKPKFMAMLQTLLQPMADAAAIANGFSALFDVDNAVGEQLDMVGLWVGVTRFLKEPIVGVYFTLDSGPGLDQGIFKGPLDPSTGLVRLPDDQYRTILQGRIANNHWDGTIVGAYAISAIVFGPGSFRLVIRDNQDMSMDLILGGPMPDPLTLALFLGGYLDIKPVGVRITEYIWNNNPDTGKIFMLDAPADSDVFGGLDEAAFASFKEGI